MKQKLLTLFVLLVTAMTAFADDATGSGVGSETKNDKNEFEMKLSKCVEEVKDDIIFQTEKDMREIMAGKVVRDSKIKHYESELNSENRKNIYPEKETEIRKNIVDLKSINAICDSVDDLKDLLSTS